MGLNIGIQVLQQSEGWGNFGSNPIGSIEEVEQSFFRFLNHKFPKGGFGHGWVHLSKNYNGKPYYCSVCEKTIKGKEAGFVGISINLKGHPRIKDKEYLVCFPCWMKYMGINGWER